MKTVAQILARWAELSSASDSPRLDTEILLGHVLGRDRAWLYTWPEYRLTEAELGQFDQMFKHRAGGEPVAYLIGVREFWSLPLEVDSSNLIPRSETELLVETALHLEFEQGLAVKALDLGTGTGAIALALGGERPDWRIVGVDKEPAAVALAERNRQRLGLENVRFVLSDWFGQLTGQKFDLIIGNPPYIAEEDPHLQQGDVRFEPRSALVSGPEGLDDIGLITGRAAEFLNPGGWLLIEHGAGQRHEVRQLFEQNGFINLLEVDDYQGLPRVYGGQISKYFLRAQKVTKKGIPNT